LSKVVLNSVVIEIEGELREKPVSPWSARMSMGTQEYADYQPASVREYSDCRGGIGMESEEEPTDRVWSSTSIELTKARYTSLGTLVTDAGDLTTPPLLMIDFETDTYIFGNGKCYYNNAGTIADADASALANPTDCIVFTDATDSYLIVCNGADVRYCTIGKGGSSNWGTLSSSNVKCMASHDKRLIGVNAQGTTVFYSARDNCDDAATGAMSSFSISGDWTAAKDLFEGKSLVTDEPILYMVTDIGLVVIDFWTRVAYLQEVTYPSTAYALVGTYWNGSVFVATGAGMAKVDKGVFNDMWGPDADDGLPSDVAGYIYALARATRWMAIAVSGNTKSCILKRNVSIGGWQEVYTSTSNIRCVHYTNLVAPGRLWFGEGNNVRFAMFPDKTHDVTKVSGYTYAASGEVIFPRLSKLSVIPKIAVEVSALTEDCDIVTENHNEKIEIYARVDDTSAWGSAIGTFSTDGAPTPLLFASGAGAAFNDIQLKAKLIRGTVTTASPKLKSLALKFIPNPSIVSSWTFSLAARGKDAKRIIANLETARDSATLVTFYPDGDTTGTAKYVKIESLPSVQELDRIGVEKILACVVTEVV